MYIGEAGASNLPTPSENCTRPAAGVSMIRRSTSRPAVAHSPRDASRCNV